MSLPDARSTTAPAAGTGKEMSAKEIEDAIMMPPPPNPAPKVILEPEMNGLQEALQNAVAQTGLIYKFYAKVKGDNVQPPRSVTASLGREIERYDQICDAVEARILRALAVLQRDLAREKQRIEDEQLALKAKEEAEKKAAGTPKQATPEAERPEPSLPSSSPLSSTQSLGRRPSSISISTLHRPSLPGKLDLSSASFRLSATEDSQSFQTGLASPVTLAPKSARPLGPNELPNDFLSTFGSSSSDLHALPDVMHNASQGAIDLTAGDSNDKPIELDMDMDMDMNMALFGDGPEPTQENRQGADDLFSPTNDPSLGTDFLADAQGDTLLSAFAAGAPPDGTSGPTIKQEETMPSPGSLLASFPSPAHQGQSDDQQQFDFGSLSMDMFSSGQHSADMDFSNMDFAMDDHSNQQNSLAENEDNSQSAETSKIS
ncbi:hypothetical protein BKA70DRAFT_1251430 [Coprinopsis sp. MPI-PUGE-AT-0042]|nr:hypothetical protein BKA70DRAFT_1251430 [Coprinopsis sp. MPI-PUGE-AT-0042]